jgi:hypothetical protein
VKSKTDLEPAQSGVPSKIHLVAALIALLVLPATTSGCARVKPWDRDLLADPRMQMEADGVDQGLDDHIYFSKEAASGGRGFGGGGCGCN